jgi:hypothetical protein
MDKNKPSIEDILELYDACKEKYEESGIYNQFDEDERFYELDFKKDLNLPDQFEDEGIVLPSARDLVDTCCDNTDIFNARIWANRKGTSNKSKEEAELLRKFGLGVIYRNNVESSVAPLRTAAKHFWLHGMAVLKTVWDADRFVTKPAQNDNESDEDYAARIDEWRGGHHDSMPIVIQSIHPSNIMFDPYHEGGTFVFEIKEELCFNVKSKFGDKWGNPKNRKTTDKVEHISFWTKKYRCELYDREPVLKGKVVEHDYGFIPYIEIGTGLGNQSADNDMKKRCVGVLRYVKGILISESRDFSIGDVILKRTAFPWGYLKGKNAQAVTDIKVEFGKYNPMPDDVEIVDVVPKMPPDALLTWLSVAANYLASHAAPASIRGEGEQGVRSGADRRLLIAQAATRYQYSNEAFKHGVAKVLSNCARIMKNVIPGSINVWARTPNDEFDIEIKPDKMKEPFTFWVEFAPISEEDEYRRHDDLERLVKSGMVTPGWARRQMSNIDPEAMELDEEVERLKQDPMVQQAISQYLASKIMMELTKRSRAEAIENPPPPMPQQMTPNAMNVAPKATNMTQKATAPSRRMAAPIPEIAALGSGQEQQNKLKGMRSQTPMTEQGRGGGGNRR